MEHDESGGNDLSDWQNVVIKEECDFSDPAEEVQSDENPVQPGPANFEIYGTIKEELSNNVDDATELSEDYMSIASLRKLLKEDDEFMEIEKGKRTISEADGENKKETVEAPIPKKTALVPRTGKRKKKKILTDESTASNGSTEKIRRPKYPAKLRPCPYCKGPLKYYQALARHLKQIHADEPDVKKALEKPAKDPERRKIFNKIGGEADLKHNAKELITNGENFILKRRSFSNKFDKSNYLCCQYCKKMISRGTLWVHVKIVHPETVQKDKRRRIQDEAFAKMVEMKIARDKDRIKKRRNRTLHDIKSRDLLEEEDDDDDEEKGTEGTSLKGNERKSRSISKGKPKCCACHCHDSSDDGEEFISPGKKKRRKNSEKEIYRKPKTIWSPESDAWIKKNFEEYIYHNSDKLPSKPEIEEKQNSEDCPESVKKRHYRNILFKVKNDRTAFLRRKNSVRKNKKLGKKPL